MLNVLIKKQFREIFRSYFINAKTGKARSRGGAVAMFVIYGVAMAVLAVMFAIMDMGLGGMLIPTERSWLYFSLNATLAIAFGTFGSVFSTFSTLYIAKDNEQLLALPIPPKTILISRMVSVLALSLMYSGVVWIPAVICYMIMTGNTIALLLGLAETLFVTLLVTAVTAVLGWVVAGLSLRLKGKSFVTVLIALVAFGIYYVVMFRASSLLTAINESGESLKPVFTSWGYVFYQAAIGASGDLKGFAIFAAISVAAFAVVMFILSKTFIRIVTTKHGGSKAVYHEKKTSLKTPKKALFDRELKRFTSSASYMLNAGIGLALEIGLAVVAVIFSGRIRSVLSVFFQEAPQVKAVIGPMALAAFVMLTFMNYISTPSISLEGDRIWVIQSLPVQARDVLKAKFQLHAVLNTVPMLILGVVIMIVLELNPLEGVLVMIGALACICFTGVFGLFLGVNRPDLHWTTEAQPIKQGMNVLIMAFGGMLLAVVVGGLYFLAFLNFFLDPKIYLVIWTVIFAVLYFIINRWLMTKGAEKFEELA